MDVNVDFVQKIYFTVKNSETYREFFSGKKVVIVLDNAPAHNQTEARLEQKLGEHSDLVLLGVFKSKVKTYLSDHRQRMFNQGAFPTMSEARMSLLEDAANASIGCMHRHLVVSMALHCQRAVADALKMEDMQYGT
ncbi:hypothetical protein PC121_g6000 [Phytophthora cactorum]|nr:hypothetical protein PC120_g25256 [Phytophthora cactorum]KAG3082634.1 hypothetical protein PC121_g6000 [Phytophthora cactorum]